MAKFELKKSVIDLEINDAAFHIPLTDAFMQRFEAEKSALATVTEKLLAQETPEIAEITAAIKASVDNLLGDGAFDSACGTDTNVFDAMDVVVFVLDEISSCIEEKMQRLENHPALKK